MQTLGGRQEQEPKIAGRNRVRAAAMSSDCSGVVAAERTAAMGLGEIEMRTAMMTRSRHHTAWAGALATAAGLTSGAS